MISSYTKEYKEYFEKYLEYTKENNYLLIWCDYESKKTYINFQDEFIELDYILTSTNLILKMLHIKD